MYDDGYDTRIDHPIHDEVDSLLRDNQRLEASNKTLIKELSDIALALGSERSYVEVLKYITTLKNHEVDTALLFKEREAHEVTKEDLRIVQAGEADREGEIRALLTLIPCYARLYKAAQKVRELVAKHPDKTPTEQVAELVKAVNALEGRREETAHVVWP